MNVPYKATKNSQKSVLMLVTKIPKNPFQCFIPQGNGHLFRNNYFQLIVLLLERSRFLVIFFTSFILSKNSLATTRKMV